MLAGGQPAEVTRGTTRRTELVLPAGAGRQTLAGATQPTGLRADPVSVPSPARLGARLMGAAGLAPAGATRPTGRCAAQASAAALARGHVMGPMDPGARVALAAGRAPVVATRVTVLGAGSVSATL